MGGGSAVLRIRVLVYVSSGSFVRIYETRGPSLLPRESGGGKYSSDGVLCPRTIYGNHDYWIFPSYQSTSVGYLCRTGRGADELSREASHGLLMALLAAY